MKTIKITLRETGVNIYTVEKFSNTAQLAIGMTVDRERLTNWATMPRVDFTILPPVKPECEESQELGDVITSQVVFDPESGQTYNDAREFDAVALELSAIHHWASESVLADAMLPDAGENNIGTVGIKGNIAKGQAMAIVRVNAAKELGLDVREVSRVAYRAQSLNVIKQFAKLLGNSIQPF